MKRISPEVLSSLESAIRKLESASSAEVVVEVRARSGSWAHADARVAAGFAWIALLILLFSPWHFTPSWVAIDVVVLYACGHFVARHTDTLRRLVTTRRERNRNVRTAAAALFYERGIANTRSETGILLYLSILERRMELIADRGVLKAVPTLEWNQLVARIHDDCNATLETLSSTINDLERLLAERLPCGEENPDELVSTPRFEQE